MLLTYWMSKKQIGEGDIKLLAAIGFCIGMDTTLRILLLSCALLFCYGVYGILTKNLAIKSLVPMAPFITLAAMPYLLTP